MFTGYHIQAVGKHSCSIWKTDFNFSLLYLVYPFYYLRPVTTSYSAIFMSSLTENKRNLTYPLSSIDSPKAIDLIGA